MTLIHRIIFVLSILAAIVCLYGVVNYWALEDISTPEQIPRIHYDIVCYFLFAVVAIAVAVVSGRSSKKRSQI